MRQEEYAKESVAYYLVYAELIHTARRRGTVTFQELAHLIGLPLSGNHMSNVIGQILGAIAENELSHGRPMLSAVTINAQGIHGKGFIPLAREHGRFQEGDDETVFVEHERQACYTQWQQTFPKPKQG